MAMGSVYFATKAAVRSFAGTFAAELGAQNIRVNSISPGLVMTNFQSKMGMNEEALDEFAEYVSNAAHAGKIRGKTKDCSCCHLPRL